MRVLVVLLWIWRLPATMSDSDPTECPVTEMGSKANSFSPFMVKIVERPFAPTGKFVTKGHGSLIHRDRVISTCAPFNDYPPWVRPHDVWMIGVNTEENECDQRQKVTSVLLHPRCKHKPPADFLVKFDIAIWVTKAWNIAEDAYQSRAAVPNLRYPLYDYYFKFPKPEWLKYTFMFMAVSDCDSGKRCQFPVFDYYREQTDKRLDHVRRKHNNDSLSGIYYIGWEECKKKYKIPPVYEFNSLFEWDSRYNFFCGLNSGLKPASDRESKSGTTADWFSGAVVVSGEGVPMGFASRSVEYKEQIRLRNGSSEYRDVQVRIFVSLYFWDDIVKWMVKELGPLGFGCVSQGSFFTTATLLTLLLISQKLFFW